MESLAVLAIVVLFTSLIGGPTALLLTYLPSKPKSIRIARTVMVLILSMVGFLFGIQLAMGSSIPFIPRLIGIIGVATSLLALLYEFKILKRKNKVQSDQIGASANGKIYAVIFASKRQDGNSELYYQHNDLLDTKVRSLPGYIKHFGIRHPETREGVTIAYFDSLEAIDQWRKDGEHMAAKDLARSHFYENYSVEITEVLDKYGWGNHH